MWFNFSGGGFVFGVGIGERLFFVYGVEREGGVWQLEGLLIHSGASLGIYKRHSTFSRGY